MSCTSCLTKTKRCVQFTVMTDAVIVLYFDFKLWGRVLLDVMICPVVAFSSSVLGFVASALRSVVPAILGYVVSCSVLLCYTMSFMPCPAVNNCCVVSCRLRLRCAASDCVGQCCVAPRCVLLLYCQWSVSCWQATPCVQCRVVLWRCAADLEEQRAGHRVHAAAGRGQRGGGKEGRAVGGVVEVEAKADVTAP